MKSVCTSATSHTPENAGEERLFYMNTTLTWKLLKAYQGALLVQDGREVLEGQ